jgi:hypothetical protein
MNRPVMKEFYEEVCKGENFQTVLSLKKMFDELIWYRVENVIEQFPDPEPFGKIKNYDNRDAKFDGCCYQTANFGLDIVMAPDSSDFGFWDTNDRNGRNGEAENILQKMGCLNQYEQLSIEGSRGLFVKKFKFPSEDKYLIEHIKGFIEKLTKATKQTSQTL